MQKKTQMISLDSMINSIGSEVLRDSIMPADPTSLNAAVFNRYLRFADKVEYALRNYSDDGFVQALQSDSEEVRHINIDSKRGIYSPITSINPFLSCLDNHKVDRLIDGIMMDSSAVDGIPKGYALNLSYSLHYTKDALIENMNLHRQFIRTGVDRSAHLSFPMYPDTPHVLTMPDYEMMAQHDNCMKLSYNSKILRALETAALTRISLDWSILQKE